MFAHVVKDVRAVKELDLVNTHTQMESHTHKSFQSFFLLGTFEKRNRGVAGAPLPPVCVPRFGSFETEFPAEKSHQQSATTTVPAA